MGAKRFADNELHTQVAIKTEADVYSKKFDIHTASQYDSIHIWELPMHVRKILQEIYAFLYLEMALHSAVFTSTSLFFPCYRAGIIGEKSLNKNF